MRGPTQRNAERSRVGCHIANEAPNNFSCADDLTLVYPSAAALNGLQRICEEFASKHYIKFSTAKSAYMCIPLKRAPPLAPLVMCLGAPSWNTCERCHAWPHHHSWLHGDEHIRKETRNLGARRNVLVRNFKFRNNDVKRQLFSSYCYYIYCTSLWQHFKMATMQRLRVTCNNTLRRLTDHLPFCGAFILCVAGGVNSFPEVRRAAAYSAVRRVGRSTNVMVCTIHSGTRRQWATQLYPHWSVFVVHRTFILLHYYTSLVFALHALVTSLSSELLLLFYGFIPLTH